MWWIWPPYDSQSNCWYSKHLVWHMADNWYVTHMSLFGNYKRKNGNNSWLSYKKKNKRKNMIMRSWVHVIILCFKILYFSTYISYEYFYFPCRQKSAWLSKKGSYIFHKGVTAFLECSFTAFLECSFIVSGLILLQDCIPHTMARGSESPCTTPSPGEKVDVSNFLQLHRQRSTSSNASDSGLESLMSPIDEEEPMSIVGSPIPFMRQRSRYISESESSVTSTVGFLLKLYHAALIKRAISWENLFYAYANNKSADQPVHPLSLISTFVVHCLHSIIPLVNISKISKL